MRIYTLIILIGLFWFSCCKDEGDRDFIVYESGSEEFGFTTGIANGKNWRALALYFPLLEGSKSLHLAFGTETKDGDSREAIDIIIENRFLSGELKLFNMKERPSDIGSWASYSYAIDGGDVAGASYRLDPKYDNYVEITSFNEETGLIIGNYSYSMLLDVNFSGGDYYERVTVEDGYFEANVLIR